MLRSPLSPAFSFPTNDSLRSCSSSSVPLACNLSFTASTSSRSDRRISILALSSPTTKSFNQLSHPLNRPNLIPPSSTPVPPIVIVTSPRTDNHSFHSNGVKRPVDGTNPVFQRWSKRSKPTCATTTGTPILSATTTTTTTPPAHLTSVSSPTYHYNSLSSSSSSPSQSVSITVPDTVSCPGSSSYPSTTLSSQNASGIPASSFAFHLSSPTDSQSIEETVGAARPSSSLGESTSTLPPKNLSLRLIQSHFQDMVGLLDTVSSSLQGNEEKQPSVSFNSQEDALFSLPLGTISIRDHQVINDIRSSTISPPFIPSSTPALSSPNSSSESSSVSIQHTPEDEVTGNPLVDEDGATNSPVMPPSPSSFASPRSTSSRNSSPPTLPPVLHLKRSNPKRLALTLPLQYASSSSPSTVTPSTICPSPSSPDAEFSSKFSSPFTPGPPKTPALAMSMGRAAGKPLKRPSLLNLITSPSSSDVVPPTPGGFTASSSHPYATMRVNRGRGRARSSTTAETFRRTDVERTSRSAYPGLGGAFTSIDESAFPSLGFEGPPSAPSLAPAPTLLNDTSTILASPSTSSISLSSSASSPSPQRRRPSNPDADIGLEPLTMGAYADGPIEIVPGVWLGAEDSVWRWDVWAPKASVVGIMNVAQEIDNPFAASSSAISSKVSLGSYPADTNRPKVDYAHLLWSHGEGSLAELSQGTRLLDLESEDPPAIKEQWKFWDAIRWSELRRRAGIPVLIHCHCGVSRSATMVIAYVMTLAASGVLSHLLGHLTSMQDTYDFVKACSPRIGPNVALVYQLVEFARNLTTLLSAHPLDPRGPSSWPTLADVETEAEWAARRREFDDEIDNPGGAGDEARALDVAMMKRAQSLL